MIGCLPLKSISHNSETQTKEKQQMFNRNKNVQTSEAYTDEVLTAGPENYDEKPSGILKFILVVLLIAAVIMFCLYKLAWPRLQSYLEVLIVKNSLYEKYHTEFNVEPADDDYYLTHNTDSEDTIYIIEPINSDIEVPTNYDLELHLDENNTVCDNFWNLSYTDALNTYVIDTLSQALNDELNIVRDMTFYQFTGNQALYTGYTLDDLKHYYYFSQPIDFYSAEFTALDHTLFLEGTLEFASRRFTSQERFESYVNSLTDTFRNLGLYGTFTFVQVNDEPGEVNYQATIYNNRYNVDYFLEHGTYPTEQPEALLIPR